MNRSEPENADFQNTSERSYFLSRNFRRAFIIALGIHLFAIVDVPRRATEITENRAAIAHMLNESVKGLINTKYLERADYKDELKKAIEAGEKVDLGDFQLNIEYMAGRIDKKRMESAKDKLKEIEIELKAEAATGSEQDILNKIIGFHGAGAIQHSYMSTLLLEGKGNCHARQKLTAALLQRIYPDMPMQYQHLKIRGVPHTRVLVKLGDDWYSMEEPRISPVSQEAKNGTVLYESDDEVDYYASKEENIKAEYVNDKGETYSTYTAIAASDDFIILPSPIGIGDIRNFDSFAHSNAGDKGGSVAGLGLSGSGTAGSTGGNSSDVWGSGGDYDPIQMELISYEEAELRAKISTNRKKYLEVNRDAPNNMPSLGETRWLPETPTWAELLSKYMESLFFNQEERMPTLSSILSHSFFQNYFLNDERGTRAKFMTDALKEICRSPKLQENLYNWSIPFLKKGFLALDHSTRAKHLETFLHLKEYLRDYDHKKEKEYLNTTNEIDKNYNAFVMVSPDDYDKYEDSWDYNYKMSSEAEKKAYSHRYAEAFVFRRIENGMTLEIVKRWVDHGIEDMRSIMNKPVINFENYSEDYSQ